MRDDQKPQSPEEIENAAEGAATEQEADGKKKKKPKKKGPIRFEAIIPTILLTGLLAAYFYFFFDGHLRRVMEFVATQAHGAEVNISRVHLDFFEPSLEINGVQVTDKNKPERNLFQVGTMKFALLWDALLRMKFVIPEASIENIEALTPRARPGRVIPKSERQGANTVAQVEDAVLEQTKSEYEGNVLGDVANILDGEDPTKQLKKIEGELKASGKLKELEQVMKEKEQAWNKRLAELPGGDDIKKLENEFKKLKFDTKNPIKFAEDLKKADKLVKQADKKIKKISKTGKQLDKDLKYTDKAFKDVEKMVQQDIKDIQQRLNIPSIDGGDFSKKLFGKMIAQRLGSFRKYIEMGREYMPPKKSDEEKNADKPVPPARANGVDVKFPITTGYPLVWVKQAKITSAVSESEYSGNIEGQITDFSTSPEMLKTPMKVTMKGDFPKQKVMGVDLLATIDHRTENPVETVDLKVGSYPMGEQVLSDSKDVTFNVKESTGQMVLTGKQEQQKVNMQIGNWFRNVEYEVAAKSDLVEEILKGVAKDVSNISINASAKGEWATLGWNVKSNLGDAIVKSFKAQVQKKINEARAKIKAMVDQKINAEKKKLQAQIDKVKNQVNGQINSKKKELDKAKKKVSGDLKKKQKGKKKSLENEGKKLLKGLGL
ncbi:MAG: TIGR03545 family protein [Bdellovibrionales bacterium]|nr:TIGR03545 family protein [Bdellovibrionales bacterium]